MGVVSSGSKWLLGFESRSRLPIGSQLPGRRGEGAAPLPIGSRDGPCYCGLRATVLGLPPERNEEIWDVELGPRQLLRADPSPADLSAIAFICIRQVQKWNSTFLTRIMAGECVNASSLLLMT
ncbi:hypothetical protein CDAR_256861 [Caerostris darwini]|uniref:Uncharacterized protein n=1 Tax=Caerostris darwini TaxID=1538125 RepID=A0AAV4PXZ3_9ARAC|nr:hypothetical protein CDAR_256861 [Caerostris darwini]